jgi:hypothetical protein
MVFEILNFVAFYPKAFIYVANFPPFPSFHHQIFIFDDYDLNIWEVSRSKFVEVF